MLQSTTSSTAQPAWGDNSCSDVTLILRRCEGFLFEDDDDGTSQKFLVKSCGSCSGPSAHPKYLPTSARVMHLHVSILSSASSFFEKMFTTEAGGWCPECRVVTCVLEGREFEAAQHVLRFTYTSKLPISNGIVPDGMLLIWMIKVADRWDVPSCLQACSHAMSMLSISTFPIHGVKSLPSNFCPAPEMIEMDKAADRYILELYGEEPYILFLEEELKLMLELPQRAMVTLLTSNTFSVDSEGTAAVMLNAWLLHNQNRCTREERLELLSLVRYGFMTAAYIMTALPLLPSVLMTAVQAKELLRMISQRTNCTTREWLRVQEVCPELWLIPRDNMVQNLGRAFNLRLRVLNPQLRVHIKAVAAMKTGGAPPRTIQSHGKLAHGYSWKLALTSRARETAFAVEVHVCSPSQDSSTTVSVECSIEISVFRESGYTLLHKSSWHSFRGSCQVYRFTCGRMAVEGEAEMEPWKHLLQDSHLCIQAEIEVKR